ncbi:TetR family transcriptional regulator, partial [Carbonactinospora thermoautotrophica]
MTAVRNKRLDEDQVLDAARACVLAVGVRRTTLTDVARRAGVSRMSLYRRWPDVRSLVADLMTREWLAIAEATRVDAGTARQRVVGWLTAGTRALRDHPLFRKIVDVDPELLLPYVLDRRGTSQEALLAMIEKALRDGHADGSVRAGDPGLQARAVLLTAQSFVLSGRTVTDACTEDALDTELRA